MATDRNGSAVVWFLAGAAVGAAIALLFAPASGREARRYITRKAEESRDAIVDAGREVLERGREYYERGKKVAEEAGEFFERGKKALRG
ncbi:MAG TPA: YtxH domain-containing protein [Bryobacteraceae bacterium]|nr:YtxH domain-containing protein [Bryobacteraceae bacterium]